MAEARDTYTDPITDRVLQAAEALSQGVYEVDPTVPPPLQAAFRGLAEAVYEWHESLDLQDELVGEGVRAGAVIDLSDPAYATTYAASVERVLAAALVVRSLATGEPRVEDASPADAAVADIPASGRPLLRDLDKAVVVWSERPAVAAQWREKGLRGLWVASSSPSSLRPHPPETTPPGARVPAKADRASAVAATPALGPSPGDDGGDSAARLHPVAVAQPPGAAPSTDPDAARRQRQRRAARHADAAARQRGAYAR